MTNEKLVLSTGNKNKIKEIREILKDLNIEVLSIEDIGLKNFNVIEDGNTLESNSIKKAEALKEKTKFMVMADDSGLFVEALNGDPGVYSARYDGQNSNDEKNNEKLLENMKDIPLEHRKASFLAVIVLITEEYKTIVVKGECKGHIGLSPKGSNGFGYDPLFIPEGYNSTFAELSGDIKNKISHRARALDGMKETLKKLLEAK